MESYKILIEQIDTRRNQLNDEQYHLDKER